MNENRDESSPLIKNLEDHFACGDYQKVVDLCEIVQLQGELPPKFWFCKGRALEKLGEKQRAIDAYRSEIAMLARIPDFILAEIGVLLGGLGKYQAAAVCMKESYHLNPTPEYLIILADFLSRLGQTEQAREALRKALELDPENDEAWNNLGVELIEVNLAEAERAFLRALKIDPDRANSYGGLARVCLAQRRTEEATQFAQKGLQRRPLDGVCHVVIGEAMEAMANFEGAVAAFSNALCCDADKPSALLGLARIFEHQGQPADAIKWYGRALRAWPDNVRIRTAYLAFAERSGRGDPKLNDLCKRSAAL